jgi:hypothetical protein
MLDPIGGSGAHDDAIALRVRAFEQARQGAVKRRRQEMIEADIGHAFDYAFS